MKKKLFIILSVLLFLIVCTFGGSYIYINNTLGKIEKDNISKDPKDLGIGTPDQSAISSSSDSSKSSSDAVVFDDSIKNIALFGIDAPEGEAGRSDSLMVLTLDQKHQKIKVTSIMRDSYVKIDGHGMDKINHAYAFGGAQLAIKTLNENFKLNIQDYAAVNFTSLPKVIDDIGGVDIDIKDYEISLLKSSGIATAGTHTLNGKQALSYCRIRYVGNGDYERTERHRVILEQIFKKMYAQGKSSLPGNISKLLPYIKTSLSNSEILELSKTAISLSNNIEKNRFPLDADSNGGMKNGVWYLFFDTSKTADKVYEYVFNDKK